MIQYLLFVILLVPGILLSGQQDTAKFYAGFRASRVLSSYPNNQFPQTDYWIRVAKEMSAKFPGSTPAGIWILSLYQNNGITQLSFPSNGLSIPYVQFTSVDYNDSHLSKLDTSGVKVWLQVEPGAAGMDTLISIVLNRYKHHPCVIGFGVDVEWFFTNTNSGGRKLTDSMVQRWDQKVRSIDSTYTLFIKHYGQSWMPPTYRGNVLFVDDSQGFASLTSMVNEFKSWGIKFSPARSAFQFGYKIDSTWWKQYVDPPATLGNALRSNIPSCSGLFWVDFTIMKVFPITSVKFEEPGPRLFSLLQNYPNPFNPSTHIEFQIPHNEFVTLRIYDMLGREIATLINGEKGPGTYSVRWNASEYASGVYIAKMTARQIKGDEVADFVSTKKLLLIK